MTVDVNVPVSVTVGILVVGVFVKPLVVVVCSPSFEATTKSKSPVLYKFQNRSIEKFHTVFFFFLEQEL